MSDYSNFTKEELVVVIINQEKQINILDSMVVSYKELVTVTETSAQNTIDNLQEQNRLLRLKCRIAEEYLNILRFLNPYLSKYF